MSVLTLSAKLDRTDGSTPWGFRMHGGKDFSAPLTIQRVTPGSLAAKCGLLVGDAITKIGGVSTDSLRHKEAQQKIMVAGNSLELTLQRGSSSTYKASDSVSAPYYSGTPQSPVNQYAPAPGAIPPAQNHNVKPKPFVTPVSGTVRVAVTTHNTPISMYSVDNVMDSLYTKANNLNIGPSQQAEPARVCERSPLAAAAATSPERNKDKKYVKAIVNKQYNSPIGLYSNTNADETFVGQSTEILNMMG